MISLFNEEHYQLWQSKFETAIENMKIAKSNKGVLIEATAYHMPLEGQQQNDIFTEVLLEAVYLYKNEKIYGRVVKIYVSGELYSRGGTQSAVDLLVSKGIPVEDILRGDSSRKYEVIGDECYEVSQLFMKHKLQGLHCICSSEQTIRKVLGYVEFGCLPHVHTISSGKTYPNYLGELFTNIPKFIANRDVLEFNSAEAKCDV